MDDPADNFEMVLRAEETLLRTDLVNTNTSVLGAPRLAVMTLTNQRVIFSPPKVSGWYRLFSWTAGMFASQWVAATRDPAWTETRHRFRPPLGHAINLELDSVIKIWSWAPRLSGPPWLQTKAAGLAGWHEGSGYDFQLCEGEIPWQRRASLEDIEAHLADVERAWTAALPSPASRNESA